VLPPSLPTPLIIREQERPGVIAPIALSLSLPLSLSLLPSPSLLQHNSLSLAGLDWTGEPHGPLHTSTPLRGHVCHLSGCRKGEWAGDQGSVGDGSDGDDAVGGSFVCAVLFLQAEYEYTASGDDEITIAEDQVLYVLEDSDAE